MKQTAGRYSEITFITGKRTVMYVKEVDVYLVHTARMAEGTNSVTHG